MYQRARAGRTAPAALGVLVATAALACAGSASGDDGQGTRPTPAREAPTTVRGITISTHTDGREWGTDAMGPTLDDVASIGASWIAYHPYGIIRGDGSVVWRAFDPDDPPDRIVRPIREAHARGLRVFVKPHLAYWGSPFAWRGDIRFDDDASWRRFFDDYERFIAALARACRDADAFAVGTELDATLDHETRWRSIIAAVRRETGAPLTYAANWTDYRRVPFWDALDVVGVQAYFPVTDALDRLDEGLAGGWERLRAELRETSEATGKRIVFTELGYTRAFDAPKRPWAHGSDGPDAEPIQAASLAAALEAIEAEPAIIGAFLWKWFPEPRPVGRDFQLATPAIRRVIESVWSDATSRP